MEDLGFSAEELAYLNSMSSSSSKPKDSAQSVILEEIPSDLSSYPPSVQEAYIKDREAETHKQTMRNLNKQAKAKRPDLPKSLSTKLDRVQKTLKKLKTISKENSAQVYSELESLNLKQHVNEAAVSLAECKMMTKDIPGLIEISCLLHQRYAGFTKTLEDSLKKQYTPAEPARKRAILRFIVELIVYDLWEDVNGFLRVMARLTDAKGEDRLHSLAILSHALKSRSQEMLLQPLSSELAQASQRGMIILKKQSVLQNKEATLLQHLSSFYSSAVQAVVDLHQQCLAQEAQNRAIKYERGKDDEEGVAKALALRAEFSKAHANLVSFADILHQIVPEFVEESSEVTKPKAELKEVNLLEVFDTEEERTIYLSLPDLSSLGNDVTVNDNTLEEIPRDVFTCNSIEDADKLAGKIKGIANKQNRKIITDMFTNVRGNMLHLLPYLSRAVAILSSRWKEIGNKLYAKIEQELMDWINGEDDVRGEQKVKCVRYLCELTKFSLNSPDYLLDVLEKILNDFSGTNIDAACQLLNGCGRFLERHPHTSERLGLLINKLQRLKTKKMIPPETEQMIDNACMSCKPPEKQIKKKPKPILYSYIKFLLLNINDSNYESTKKILSCMTFPESESFLITCMIKSISKIKFQDIHQLASLMLDFKYMKGLNAISNIIIDCICEDILADLRNKDPKRTQHRMLYITFIGELYSWKAIKHELVLDILYALIYYSTGKETAYDTIRINLICALLDKCSKFWKSGRMKIILNRYLVHFQNFIFSKKFIPIDLTFILNNLFEKLHPDVRLNLKNRQEIMNSLMQQPLENIESSESEEEAKNGEDFYEENKEQAPDSGKQTERVEDLLFEQELNDMITSGLEEVKGKEVPREKTLSTAFSDILSKSPKRNFKVLIKKAGKVTAKTISVPEEHSLTRIAEERKEKQQREREILSRAIVNLQQTSYTEDESETI